MNKKAAEKIISVYWFAILFIVAAAVVYMVFSFYGKPYDIRDLESDALTDHIARCLNNGGYIMDNWQSLSDEDIPEVCKLNFNVENEFGWNNNQYFIKITISDFNSGQELKQVSTGNLNLNLNCAIEDENSPVCLERKMYSIDKENNQYQINILSIVRKTEKNTQ